MLNARLQLAAVLAIMVATLLMSAPKPADDRLEVSQ
jgi:hypothetical protein